MSISTKIFKEGYLKLKEVERKGNLNLESISTKIFKEGYLKLKKVQRRRIFKV